MEKLGAGVRAIVERYRQSATKLSKNQVSAGDVHVAVHLREPASGAQFGLDSTRAHRPASNMKLVTTAAALTLLGPDWCFETPIEASGPIVEGSLQGNLVLRASGDPLFDPAGVGSVARLLAPALDELQRRGLKRVRGDLVLDERSFDTPRPAPGWPGEDQRFEEHRALAGGFSANRGCLTVQVSPTRAGEAAAIAVQPAGFGLERQFSAVTSASGKLTIGFDARPTGLIVRGNIPRASPPFIDSCAFPDPVELFGGVLRHELSVRGIQIDGGVVRTRGASGGAQLAQIRTPLLFYLTPINQESNNACADQLFLGTALAILGSASRAGAQDATLQALERLGVRDAGFRQVDGSGLSDQNRVSARQLTALVEAVLTAEPRTAKAYRDSLAVAGVSGTLGKRMRGTPAQGKVFAKTGFIGGTSALSGIAQTRDGSEIVFSILVDYEEFGGLNTSVWKPMQDDICELLVASKPKP